MVLQQQPRSVHSQSRNRAGSDVPTLQAQRLSSRKPASLEPVTRSCEIRSASGWGAASDDGLRGITQRVGAGLAAVAAAVSLVAGPWVAPPSASAVTAEQLLFLEAWRAIDRAYVDKSFNGQAWFRVREQYLKNEPMVNRAQTYAAIRKLVASLDDPFTRFLEPDRLAALKLGTTGSVSGIGVEVTFDKAKGANSELVVVAPLPDGPAERAGIRPGDVLVAVDGKPTKGISLYDASDLLQGPEGTDLTLTVRSADKGPTREVVVKRQKVVVNPVAYTACSSVNPAVFGSSSGGSDTADSKVGYIRLSTFSSQTVPAFEEALSALRKQGADGHLVLDIRNNGGGLFPAGVQLGKLLLDKGDIVLIADSQGTRDIYSADGSAIEPSAPLAVLVNRGTASASEVLAGALQDNGRATVVGEETFGKGLIQTVVDLSDGSGVTITVARYQTPLGTDINKVGIAPDIRLKPEQMPPTSGTEAFCSALAGPQAPRLFK